MVEEREEQPVYLRLFNGRNTVDEELEDWGVDGPWLGPLSYAQTSWNRVRIKISGTEFGDSEIFLGAAEDQLYYNGVFYGDWTIVGQLPEGITAELPQQELSFLPEGVSPSSLIDAAYRVLSNWENGDLVGAIRELREATGFYRERETLGFWP